MTPPEKFGCRHPARHGCSLCCIISCCVLPSKAAGRVIIHLDADFTRKLHGKLLPKKPFCRRQAAHRPGGSMNFASNDFGVLHI